jgi:hypothetical protein
MSRYSLSYHKKRRINNMDEARSADIVIGGIRYKLVLTTKATKEIAKRYGGLENLGDKLMKSENFEMALDEIVWLITLLANQSVLINNRLKGEKNSLLTEDDVELLTSPLELSDYKEAIMIAMFKGTKRYIESEETESKNASVG